MRDSRRFILDHEFYCTRCGNKGISVVRDKKRSREKGHLKKLYCLTCKEEINHVECSMALGYTYETFLMNMCPAILLKMVRGYCLLKNGCTIGK